MQGEHEEGMNEPQPTSKQHVHRCIPPGMTESSLKDNGIDPRELQALLNNPHIYGNPDDKNKPQEEEEEEDDDQEEGQKPKKALKNTVSPKKESLLFIVDDNMPGVPENTLKFTSSPVPSVASCVLSRYLTTLPIGKNVLVEIGAGEGLPSMVYAALGGMAYATELPQCLSKLTSTVTSNKQCWSEEGGNIEIGTADWTVIDGDNGVKGLAENVGKTYPGKKVGYIVCADLINNSSVLVQLPKYLKALCDLLGYSPLILVAHRKRTEWVDGRVIPVFEENGFDGEELDPKMMPKGQLHRDITIFRFRLKIIK